MTLLPHDPGEWARISYYLDQVLDLEPPERGEWLKSLQATQPAVAADIEEWLTNLAALDAKNFLAGSVSLRQLEALLPEFEQMMRSQATVEPGDWTECELPAGYSAGAVAGAYRRSRTAFD